MSGWKKQGTGVRKKRYVKPEAKQVQLKPEEAVLGFCKSTTSTIGPGSYCQLTCPTLGS